MTDYLVAVETEYMGLGAAPAVRLGARDVAKALSEYVAELRG